MSAAPTLAWVDGLMLATLAVSMGVGLWRGLVFELMSLVGWLAAYVLAQAYAPAFAQWVPIGPPGSALHQGAAFAATFVLALLAWSLLARLLRMLIHATPLTIIDRLLGAGFGLLRGLLLLLVLATVVALTPEVHSAAWLQSRGAQWLRTALLLLRPWLPDELARHLPQQ
jgi:membrane protein required for colicin V production